KMADFDEYTFDRGFQPNGNLIQLADGNFYGTCSKGGTNDKGTIFSMDNVGAITVIKDLVEATDGSEPMGSLALATDGYMYGLCSKGGENGDGTVFRVGTTTGDFTTIISLNDASQVQNTGKKPSGSLYSASNGQLYGTCEEGGKYYGINDYSNSIYSGTIFKLKLPGDFIKLVDLNNSTQRNSGDVDAPIQTGRNPVGGSFVEGIDGFLYGVATNGGIEIPAANYYDQIKSYGTIYKLSKSGKEYTKLRDFEPAPDGNKPEFAGLISVAGVCSDPIVSIKLSSSEVCERSVITLTVSITGTIGTPSLQWQRGNYAIDYNGYGDINTASNFINIINDSIMNGATTASLTITVNPNMNDFAFRCNVADACGSTLSNLLGFKVFPNVTPTITLTSTIQAICAGDGVPFRVDRTDPFKVNYNARNSYTIYVNGIPFQTSEPNYFYNLPTFNVTSLTNASIVTATMTTTGQLCLVKNTATSTGIAISVYPKPLVTLNLVPDTITVITPITTLAGGLPEGGTYSGGSTFAPFYFFPQSAGLGDKSIIYSFTNPGCTVTAQQNLTVIKAKQAITGMNNIYDQPIGNQTLLLNGVQGGLSGNDVNFSIKTDPLVGVAVLSAKVISFLGVGNITLTASQIGDVKYFAADTVRRSFAISSKQGQSISGFAALPDLAVGNVYTISGVAPGVTGNPVTFSSSNPLVAAVNGNIITAVSEGSAIITAFQAGNDTYLSATTNQPLAIVAAFSTFSSQTIKNFNALPILKVGDTFNINGVTGGESGNKVSFTSSDLSVATIDGVTIYALKSGNTIITATQAGNTKYLNATPIFQLLTVQSEIPPVAFTKLPQTIVGVTTRIKVSVNQSIATLFSSNRGLPLMYRIDSSAIASITKGIITGKRAGLATLIVSQPGDSAFLPATSIFVPILVVDKPSPITFSIAGPDTVGLFQEVIYSQLLVAGYRYHWSYTGNKLLFISDTTSNLNQIQVYFNDLTTQGDILNDIYDNEGAFVGRFRLPISIISFPQSRDLAFVDCEVSTNCKENFIKYFKLNSLENASGCSSGGIGDFTSTGKVDTLLMGDNCSADVKSTTTTKNAYFGIWIDYNNNGSFADADDFVASSFEADSVFSIKNLIIRNNNKYAGARRLRINMRIGGRISTQNSCLVAGEAGETEDYLVFIKGQDALEASPIITPNEDGKNDIFQIRGINPKESNKLSILDRIGAMRYEKVNYENDWRGVDKNGNMLDEGTYFYFFNNGERQIKGFLEVKRE
ncbi:MAG: choice-of-anchor tandem repeat GloVer-containing protein, partial [Cytophagales bacterium]